MKINCILVVALLTMDSKSTEARSTKGWNAGQASVYNANDLSGYSLELLQKLKESLKNKIQMLLVDNQITGEQSNQWPLVDNKFQDEQSNLEPIKPVINTATKAPVQVNSNSNFNTCQQQFQTACIQAHNKYRALHNAPPLRTNSNLQISAYNYAKTLAAQNIFQHSGQKGIGENLAYSWSSSVSSLANCGVYAEKYVKMWYDEEELYNYNNPGFSSSTGHFTQVVWRSTTDVGCGLAISGDNKIYAVSQYTPPGNFGNEYVKNVLPK